MGTYVSTEITYGVVLDDAARARFYGVPEEDTPEYDDFDWDDLESYEVTEKFKAQNDQLEIIYAGDSSWDDQAIAIVVKGSGIDCSFDSIVRFHRDDLGAISAKARDQLLAACKSLNTEDEPSWLLSWSRG